LAVRHTPALRMNALLHSEAAAPALVRPPREVGRRRAPEDARGVAAVAAGLLAEARGVADILQRQLRLLKPLLAVQRAQRLLRRRDQVLVVALACGRARANIGYGRVG